jgi:hypothetical protein
MTRLRRRRGIRPTGTVSGPITPLSLSMVAVAQRLVATRVARFALLSSSGVASAATLDFRDELGNEVSRRGDEVEVA